MFATYAIKIDVLHVVKTFLKRNLIPLLRCTVLCWVVTGCGHGIMEESPYTYFYTPPKTPPRDLHTLVDKRIGAYKTLIKACKEAMEFTMNVEDVTYAQIRKAYLKFALNNHPDKGGDEKIFQNGGGAWKALNDKLKNDSIDLGSLKDVQDPLLTYLKSYLKTHIEKNIETYREKDSATPPQ